MLSTTFAFLLSLLPRSTQLWLRKLFATMARKHKNPMTNPLHYATQQLLTGAPTTYATAQRKLPGYDYGE